MNDKMEKWKYVWKNIWIDGWMSGWINKRKYGQNTMEEKNGRKEQWKKGNLGGWMNRWKDRGKVDKMMEDIREAGKKKDDG